MRNCFGRIALAILMVQLISAKSIDQEELVQKLTLELQEKIIQDFPALIMDNIQNFDITTSNSFLDLPDPLQLDNLLSFQIPAGSDMADTVFGELNTCNSTLNGLSTLEFSLEPAVRVRKPRVSLTLKLSTGKLSFTGSYDTDLTIEDGDYYVSGSGQFRIEVDQIDLTVKVFPSISDPPNRLSIHELSIDLNFATVELFAENFIVNDELYDWDDLNSKLKPTFDALWPGAKPIIENTIETEVNDLLKDCPILDLVSGNFDCFSSEESNSLTRKVSRSVRVKAQKDKLCSVENNPSRFLRTRNQ